jgi:hypothetical protein
MLLALNGPIVHPADDIRVWSHDGIIVTEELGENLS